MISGASLFCNADLYARSVRQKPHRMPRSRQESMASRWHSASRSSPRSWSGASHFRKKLSQRTGRSAQPWPESFQVSQDSDTRIPEAYMVRVVIGNPTPDCERSGSRTFELTRLPLPSGYPKLKASSMERKLRIICSRSVGLSEAPSPGKSKPVRNGLSTLRYLG